MPREKSITTLLKEYESKDVSSVIRRFEKARPELERISDKTEIPEATRKTAEAILLKALEKDLVRGRSYAAITAASVTGACRKTGVPITLREIAETSLTDKKDVARCYRLFLRENVISDLPEANPFEYVSKIAEKIGISGRSQRDAVNILKKTRGTEAYKGKDPFGVAAAALYISCIQNNEKKTQRDMAEAAGVTEVTVRNRYKSLKRQLEFYI